MFFRLLKDGKKSTSSHVLMSDGCQSIIEYTLHVSVMRDLITHQPLIYNRR
jgi:hypothetical protein